MFPLEKSNEKTEKHNTSTLNISGKESLDRLSHENIQPTYANIVKKDKGNTISRYSDFETESPGIKQKITDMALKENIDFNTSRQTAKRKRDISHSEVRKSDRLQKNPLGVLMLQSKKSNEVHEPNHDISFIQPVKSKKIRDMTTEEKREY